MKNSNEIKVLVTGVGAIIGYGIVNSLKQIEEIDIYVIGIDVFSDAVGRHWCDAFVQGVYAHSLEFNDFLVSLVQQHEVDLIIPGIEQDVDALNRMVESGALPESLVAVNSKLALRTFQHKLRTSQLQAEIGMPHIPFVDAYTAIGVDDVIRTCGLPCIYKPYSSYAGKGLAVLYNRAEVESKLNSNEGIFQKYINSGIEYTVSVFGLDNGCFINPIAFKRQLGPDGATHKAKVVDFSLFESMIQLLCDQTKPKGPTNFQFIADENSDAIFLLEVNPRISSSTSIRQKFGVNETVMCLEYYVFNEVPKNQLVRYGTAERYIDEVVSYDSDSF
ncbi:hypothetical protein AB6E04_12990 [Vibrio amylolyticus]|uniref:hypothetical protein n=1 Tax=Vibrio amylolyticus TaxID=2847292 RepID=UPI003550EBAD